jgi:hypothetical protein
LTLYTASTRLELLEEGLPVLIASLVVAYPHDLRFGETIQLYMHVLLLFMVGSMCCSVI